jgi:hypothetical protein
MRVCSPHACSCLQWTGWTLLVALALYDLCAVLTPCGPLKKLVELAQEYKDPIPGLLYEAEVGNKDSNPGAPVVRDTIARPNPSHVGAAATTAAAVSAAATVAAAGAWCTASCRVVVPCRAVTCDTTAFFIISRITSMWCCSSDQARAPGLRCGLRARVSSRFAPPAQWPRDTSCQRATHDHPTPAATATSSTSRGTRPLLASQVRRVSMSLKGGVSLPALFL